MGKRSILGSAVVVCFILITPGGLTAQTPAPRIIEIVMTPFKFEPNQIHLTEGETVVIRLINADRMGRVHNVAATYLANLPVVLRGDATQGLNEGRRVIAVEAGRSGEFEFVARGRGSYPFICDVTIHAFLGQTGAFFVRPAQVYE